MARWLRRPQVNRIITILIYSDLLFLSAGGFLTPIYAVFITGQVRGGSVAVVGFATTIFWVIKSLAQFPVSWYADQIKGERDDYAMMIVGSTIASTVPLLYYFYAVQAWQVYLLEALNGLGFALAVPTFLAMFTRHIDKNRENLEWTLHSNAVGLGFAATAALGGVLGDRFGLRVIFLIVSAVMFLGTAVLLLIKEDILDGDRRDGRAAEFAAQLQKEMTKQ
jgi:MFS family permease